MREVATSLRVLRSLIASGAPWLFFARIPLASGGEFRLVHDRRHQTAAGKKWQACTMAIELDREDAEGTLGGGSIVIPNVGLIPGAFLEVEAELRGQEVTVWLQHAQSLAFLDDALSWSLRVTGAEADERHVRLRCGHTAQGRRIPSRVFDRRIFPQLLPTAGFRR